jgi:hypothetical protein
MKMADGQVESDDKIINIHMSILCGYTHISIEKSE